MYGPTDSQIAAILLFAGVTGYLVIRGLCELIYYLYNHLEWIP